MKDREKRSLQPGVPFRWLLTHAVCVLLALCILLLQSLNFRAGADLFENRMSMDKTPVEFSVGPVQYRIPRNYLFKMDNWTGGPQRLVSLRAQYPGFAPFSQETEACFSKHMPCQLIEIHLGVPDSGETPEQAEFGYERYKSGPDTARVDFYRKVLANRKLIFMCQPFDNRGNPDGVCSSIIRIQSGGQVSYFFSLRQLGEAQDLDAGVRSLVESFIVGDGK
jgi:hypothetical protein